MNERLVCPVVDQEPSVDSLSRFRQRTSQELIRRPVHAAKIIESAEDKVRGYYAPVIAIDPVFGEYKVTRALRSMALSATLFNGATFTMNYLAPELSAYNAEPGDKKPFALHDYFSPLRELNIFRFETPQCKQFVQDVGSIIKDWGEVGILDPDEDCIPLAKVTKDLHTKYVDAQYAASKGTTTEDMETFLKLLAEDNAHAVLHSLIGLGGLTQYQAGDRLSADLIASEAIIEQQKLAGLASVGRTFAQEKIRPEFPPDWRAADVVAYENALINGEAMPRSSTESYFVIKNGYVTSPHISLEEAEWREPGLCAGFHRYNANYELNKGNERFFKEGAKVVNVQLPQDRVRTMFSTADVGINLGIIAGLYTIYPDFPQVT